MIDNKLLNIINSKDCKIGIYVIDSISNKITFNEDDSFEIASCGKLFVLIELFKQFNENKIDKNKIIEMSKIDCKQGLNSGVIHLMNMESSISFKIIDLATLMMVFSDNIATNKLIELLGLDNINSTIKELGLVKTLIHNDLNLLKYFKFCTSTPYEYASIYNKLLKGDILNKETSNEILEILKKQQLPHIIQKGIPGREFLFRGTELSNINYVASKSGTITWIGDEMSNTRIDGGIISTTFGDYIVSIFISGISDLSFDYDNEGIEIGGEILRSIHDEFIINKGVIK